MRTQFLHITANSDCTQSTHGDLEASEATRSVEAARKLIELGFPHVYVLEGNVIDLRKAGFLYHAPPTSTLHQQKQGAANPDAATLS